MNPTQLSAAGTRPFAIKMRRSIATLVVVALLSGATILLIGMGLFNHVSERREEQAKLARQLAMDADKFSAGLSLPLWNFDYGQVVKIMDSAMQDQNLYGVVIRQVDPANPAHSMISARVRNASWRSVPSESEVKLPGLLVEERQIQAMGETLGSVKLYATDRFLQQELQERLVSTVIWSLVFDLLLIAILYFLLWRVVINPLRAIERYALAVKTGEAAPSALPLRGFHGELESLRRSIQDMVALLQSRLGSLTEKESTLRAILDSVPQAIYWKDAQGRYLGCNKVFAGMAHLETPEAAVGRQHQDLSPADGHPAIYQADDMEILHAGSAKIHALERVESADGEVQWFDVTKVPILDAEGKPHAVLGVFEDFTERKKAEEERARLQEQLNQSQKMESIGRLAGGVAHDNNNMLMAILMHAELLREHLSSDAVALRHVKAMEGAAQRSAGLIRQLLAFSRKQVIEPKVIDLNELLDGFRKSIAPLVGEDIDFTLKPGPDLWPVRMDPAQVDQVAMNLVVNARDAMPNGGSISIETSNVEIDEHYCAENPWALPGDYVLLSVSDTGTGMSADIRRQIFEPFFTTKEIGKGTGLGLSTVFGIVKQNDGFINVYSEPNLGATFRIYLRRYTGESLEAGEKEDFGPSHHGKEHILVVEDDEVLRDVIPRILERLGYTYLMADTPLEALGHCADPDTRIDILLTDVVMPGMSGKELCENARALRPELKVLYMSGYTAEVISRQGVLDSGVHFIQKPFSTRDLGEKLRSVLSV